jgi:hypothetical protein
MKPKPEGRGARADANRLPPRSDIGFHLRRDGLDHAALTLLMKSLLGEPRPGPDLPPKGQVAPRESPRNDSAQLWHARRDGSVAWPASRLRISPAVQRKTALYKVVRANLSGGCVYPPENREEAA